MTNQENYFRLVSLISTTGVNVLRECLKTYLQQNGYDSLPELLNKEVHALYHLWQPTYPCCCGHYNGDKKSTPSLTNYQWNLLYDRRSNVDHAYQGLHPCQYVAKATLNLSDLDITLCRFLLVKVAKGLRPGDVTYVDDVREFRNLIAHKSDPEFDDTTFQQKWTDMRNRLTTLAGYVSPQFRINIYDEIEGLATKSLDGSECERMITVLKMMLNQEMEGKIDQVMDKITEVQDKQHVMQTTLDRAVSSIEEKLTRVTGEERVEKRKENYISGVRNNILANTNLVLKKHKEGLYVPQTRILQKARDHLTKSKVVILTGKGGCGKTTSAKQLLVDYSIQIDGATNSHTPIILQNPDDWNSVAYGNDKTVIFIDDPFGKSNLDDKELDRWQRYFDSIVARTKEGSSLVVISIRTNILNESEGQLRKCELFHKDNVLDLTSADLKMTPSEKQEMFEAFCDTHDVAINDKTKEGILHELVMKAETTAGDKTEDLSPESISYDDSSNITWASVRKIAESDPLIGFPQACVLFFSIDSLFGQGVSFFTNADQKLIREISKLRKGHPLQYCVLVYVLLEGGEIDLDQIDMMKFGKLKTCLDLNEDPMLFDIQDCVMYEISNAYIEQVNSITHNGIHQNDTRAGKISGGVFRFTHQSILESVLISFCERYPKFFLQLGQIQVINDFARSSGYVAEPGEICVCLPAVLNIELAETLVQRWGICAVPVHRATTDPSFQDALFNILEKSKNVGHALILVRYRYISPQESSLNKAFNAALHLAVRLDRFHFLQTMCRRFSCFQEDDENLRYAEQNPKPMLSVKSYLVALNYLLEKGDIVTVRSLVQSRDIYVSCVRNSGHSVNLQNGVPTDSPDFVVPICFAAENKWKKLVLCLLDRNANVCLKDGNGKNLIDYCCENDWLDIFETIIYKHEGFFYERQSFLSSYLNRAARHGSKSIVSYLRRKMSSAQNRTQDKIT